MLHLFRSVPRCLRLPPAGITRCSRTVLPLASLLLLGLSACRGLPLGSVNLRLPDPSASEPSPPDRPPLHLLTWQGYAPPELIQQFEESTGFTVAVTYIRSNAELLQHLAQQGQNQPSIAYDLVTPLASDLPLTQDQYLPYQPLDLNRIDNLKALIPIISRQAVQWNNLRLIQPKLSQNLGVLSASKMQNAVGQATAAPDYTESQYGLPAAWGTLGLVVKQSSQEVLNQSVPETEGLAIMTQDLDPNSTLPPVVTAYRHLCDRPLNPGIALPDRFLSLMAAAYAQKLDPFQILEQSPPNPQAWEEVLDRSDRYLQRCQDNIVAQGQDHQQMLDLLYDGGAIAALAWDNTGWLLQQLKPEFQFIVPEEGALGWMTVFSIPQKADNLDAAYAWINFLYQPAQAATFTLASGFLSPIADTVAHLPPEQQTLIQPFYRANTLDRIHWLPPHPLVLESVTATYLKP